MFSQQLLDHVVNPRNLGPIPDGSYGCAGIPGDGPYVEFWTLAKDAHILKAAYHTYGCPAAIGSASCLAELVVGHPIEFALQITARDLEAVLGGLPEGKGHCPQLAVDALKSSLQIRRNDVLS